MSLEIGDVVTVRVGSNKGMKGTVVSTFEYGCEVSVPLSPVSGNWYYGYGELAKVEE